MWKTVSRRSDTRRELTASVHGAYQAFGPQGTMARVSRPCALRAATRSTSSLAMTRPISAESATRRSGTRRFGCFSSSSAGTRHHS